MAIYMYATLTKLTNVNFAIFFGDLTNSASLVTKKEKKLNE